MHKAMFAFLPLDDLLYPRCPLVHQVPAPYAAVKPRVDLIEASGRTHWAQHWAEGWCLLDDSLCVFALTWPAYRFDEVFGAVRQTCDVNLGLQCAVNWSEETLWAVDAHHSLLTDLHTDAVLQFIHRDLHVTHHGCFSFTYNNWTTNNLNFFCNHGIKRYLWWL